MNSQSSPTQRQIKCHPYFKRPRNFNSAWLRFQAEGLTGFTSHTGPWKLTTLLGSYHFPANTAPGGATIAIIELGGGWVQSDMAAFFASINQPVPNITDVSVDGTQNSLQNSQHATGKQASIRGSWAQDIAPALTAAMTDGCDVCSTSWGADEADWGNAG